MEQAPTSTIERRLQALEDGAEEDRACRSDLLARLEALELAGFERRVGSLEAAMRILEAKVDDLAASARETLELVRAIRLEEANREVKLLRDLLRVALTGGAGGGAVGTAAYAILQALQHMGAG